MNDGSMQVKRYGYGPSDEEMAAASANFDAANPEWVASTERAREEKAKTREKINALFDPIMDDHSKRVQEIMDKYASYGGN